MTYAGQLGWSYRAAEVTRSTGPRLFVAQYRMGDGPWVTLRDSRKHPIEYSTRRQAEEAAQRAARDKTGDDK